MTESKEKALIVKSDDTTVAVSNHVNDTKKPKRKILDEEEYIEVMYYLPMCYLQQGFPDIIHCTLLNHYLN